MGSPPPKHRKPQFDLTMQFWNAVFWVRILRNHPEILMGLNGGQWSHRIYAPMQKSRSTSEKSHRTLMKTFFSDCPPPGNADNGEKLLIHPLSGCRRFGNLNQVFLPENIGSEPSRFSKIFWRPRNSLRCDFSVLGKHFNLDPRRVFSPDSFVKLQLYLINFENYFSPRLGLQFPLSRYFRAHKLWKRTKGKKKAAE